jgi:hypothetical protein
MGSTVAARRAGNQIANRRDADEHERNANERHHIDPCLAVQHAANESRPCQRTDEPDDRADGDHPQSLSHHQAQHLARAPRRSPRVCRSLAAAATPSTT